MFKWGDAALFIVILEPKVSANLVIIVRVPFLCFFLSLVVVAECVIVYYFGRLFNGPETSEF